MKISPLLYSKLFAPLKEAEAFPLIKSVVFAETLLLFVKLYAFNEESFAIPSLSNLYQAVGFILLSELSFNIGYDLFGVKFPIVIAPLLNIIFDVPLIFELISE